MRTLGIVVALFVVACGGDNPGGSMDLGASPDMVKASTPVDYLGSASPGDVWSFTLDRGAGTFTGSSDGGKPSDPSAAFTISGTLEVLSNKFLKLTVTKYTGSGSGPAMDGMQNVGYGLEIPGVVLLIKPLDKSAVVSAVYKGTCAALSGNGFGSIRTGFGATNFDVSTSDVYGSVTMNGNASAPTIENGNGYVISGTQVVGDGTAHAFDGKGTGTCTNGVISFPNGVTGVATMASSGIMVLDQGPGNGGVVVMGHATLDHTPYKGKTFNGFVFHNNSDQTDVIQVSFDANGKGTAAPYTDVAANTTGAAAAVINNLTQNMNGFVDAQVFGADGTSNPSVAHGLATTVSDPSAMGTQHTVLFFIAQDNGGTAPVNVLLIEEPGTAP